MPNPFEPILNDMRSNLSRRLEALPAKAGALIVFNSNQAFINQGWTDETFEPWAPRQVEEKGGKKGNEGAAITGRAILVKSGRLRRSIRIISSTLNSVTVGTDVPYAQAHNEGGEIHHPERGGILNFDSMPQGQLWRFGKVGTISQQRKIVGIRRVTYKAHTTKMKKRKFLGDSHKLRHDIQELVNIEIMKALKPH
jgi:phage gpG-like protein